MRKIRLQKLESTDKQVTLVTSSIFNVQSSVQLSLLKYHIASDALSDFRNGDVLGCDQLS